MIIGRYEIYFWEKISANGVSGWIVAVHEPGGFGQIMSKHKTRREAVIAAKRFTKIDENKSEIVPWNAQ